MEGFTAQISPVASAIISIAILMAAGFILTRVTGLVGLPNVTGYIIAGIIVGPYCLNLIPTEMVSGTAFLPDIALAFIAFSTGEFFRFETLRKNGIKVIIITVFEALMATALVFILTFYILKLSLAFSIVLAALASATAPASTMMTIRQTHAHGDFVDTLLQVVALDDVVGLIAYSVAISIALSSITGEAQSASAILIPIATNLGAVCVGSLFGVLLSALMKKHNTDNRLIIAIAVLFAFCGLCALVDISPLLGCMSMSTMYINISKDEKLFRQLNYWTPPILLLFFVRSGVSFDLGVLFKPSEGLAATPLVLVGILYFVVRIVGKYIGAYLGCRMTGKDKKVSDYLGLALIPQAGVAIGLAALGARTLGGVEGNVLQTVILASSVLYELIGPGCGKLALRLSGSYSDKLEDIAQVDTIDENGQKKSETELLIERIRQVQSTLPQHDREEDERAFSEAAEEYYSSVYRSRNPKHRSRR